ncbi:hypothetical protein COW94_04695 [Candidatus Peregrinibacteria bacterium CG22_combo_CG10-13_8_21_14_all_44_10]|nr:MAG: hypothetical protein AUK45_03065 [Candidatus Peregrinibacteria bacterium CG2_30_44_17]PIP65874.1 MAG: hypothetical protein COW94_04695 [Candidatus Peregrinibacteria bacterium CG22_combo_CG10-13_8_21_14_all_44_10]PIS04512.1 MAG: hypothetical protein COT83_00120 [Candidatus Peregrinibacteria bacterium CG10_big_fil_rev_8_21_14_0_10_44_7]PIX80197.1 MAG: hypothetical protein COZ35_01455 [Candidatus Peregrinibacteria bacterium CG_4_10_14_3_um_filter_44_21]
MTNVLIISITIIVLAVLFVFTMLNVLSSYKTKVDAAWDELDKIWIQRRDTVPYLLETARIDDSRWKALKDKRAELMQFEIDKTTRIELEEQLGNAIAAMIAVAREHEDIKRDTGFLEAEKDLRKDLQVFIDESTKKFEEYAAEYNDKITQFPYIIAAKIFRLHRI